MLKQLIRLNSVLDYNDLRSIVIEKNIRIGPLKQSSPRTHDQTVCPSPLLCK